MSSPAEVLKVVSSQVKPMAQARPVVSQQKKPSLRVVENANRTFVNFAEALPVMKTLNAFELKNLPVSYEGECLSVEGSKESLDVINHIKVALRSRGFGCYALHNYVWIVPFIHPELHISDFERAKKSLPDLKGELFKKAFPDANLSAPQVLPTLNVMVMPSVQETPEPEVKLTAAVAPKPKSHALRNGLIGLGVAVVTTLVFIIKTGMSAR